MHVDLTFMEIITAVAILIGAAWSMLKLTVSQFNKGLNVRFAAMDSAMKLRADAQDVKLAHIDLIAMRLQQLETDGLRQHAAYLEKFSTKDELKDSSARHDRTLEGIFNLLRSIDDKLSNKVDRTECSGCRGMDRQ